MCNNHIRDLNDDKLNIIKNKNNIPKKSSKNKNVILEKDFEDILDGDEKKEAIDRLNKAYERFGKENLNILNQ